MDREQYNSCIAQGMSGLRVTPQERRTKFCVTAKMCSGKAKSEEEALALCSQPKKPKPEGDVKHRRSKKQECPEFDTATLIPHCEKKLTSMVTSGELPSDIDISGICQLILG